MRALVFPAYLNLVDASTLKCVLVADGEFGAMMQVQLVNDGPVTISLETDGK